MNQEKTTDLQSVYEKVKARIERVDFSLLWKDFKPLKFALYNEKECFFDGNFITKTPLFCANTAVSYNDEMIAIWNLSGMDSIDFDILASKMIHEMFHAFQTEQKECRFPDEMKALLEYQISSENLSVKLMENTLIAKLTQAFNADDFNRLLRLRKTRLVNYPDEYRYEAAVEQIEGSAVYVECGALKQLSQPKYCRKIETMRRQICAAESMLPIRVECYDSGALLFSILKAHTPVDFEAFTQKLTMVAILEECEPLAEALAVNEQILALIEQYTTQTKRLVHQALDKKDRAAEGDLKLLSVNIYDARRFEQYIVSTYFVMVEKDGSPLALNGDFVIEMKDENKASSIFRL